MKNVRLLWRIARNRWTRGFSSLQILQEIRNDLRKRNTEPQKFTDQIIFISMFNDIDWTRKGWNLYFEFRRSQGIREEILAWTLDVPRSWRRKKWYGILLLSPEGKWDSTATQMVERFKDTSHPVSKSIRVLSRGILKEKNNRDTIHFNADASNTELLFRIIHSGNQLSIYRSLELGICWSRPPSTVEEP